MKRDEFSQAPIIKSLSERADDFLGFHMPGHQRGAGLWPPFQELLAQKAGKLDLTELPGLDNLGAATDCIAQSQELTSALVGSVKSYYLVNGATVGLQAALLAANRQAGRVLIPAHAHMSLYNGLILSGGRPVILPVSVDQDWGIPLGVPVELFSEKGQLPASEVLVSVNPTYQGLIADLGAMKQWIAMQNDTAWLVDEAHGAHLPFTAKNSSAMAFQADLVVQSSHKMLGALTQTAVLHCGAERWLQPIQQALNVLQTSSPSYILMSALDSLQAFMHEEGQEKVRQAQDLAYQLAEGIRSLGVYRLCQDELPPGYLVDPCKITLRADELGINGFMLSRILREEYYIDVEMATQQYVLLLITMGHTALDIKRLLQALEAIKDSHHRFSLIKSKGNEPIILVAANQLIEPEFTPRQVFFSPHQLISLRESVGQIAAVAVVMYPPGIPIIYPGMRIEQKQVEAIEEWCKLGQTCVGIDRQSAQHIRVMVCKQEFGL